MFDNAKNETKTNEMNEKYSKQKTYRQFIRFILPF